MPSVHKHKDKTKKELEELHQRVAELKKSATERKRVEEDLRKSEEKYKTLTENVNVGVYRNSVGPKGKFIEANPAIIKIFGYQNKEEFLSINVADLYQNPKERKIFNGKMLRNGFVKEEVLRLKRKDGTPFIGSVSAVAVKDEKGRVKYYDGVIEDITKRKRTEEALRETEERFRAVADNALAWIWDVDADGLYTYASPIVEKILGYKPEEIVGVKHFYELFHPEDRKKPRKMAFAVFAKKKPFREFINRNIHKNGKTVWLSTSGMPILDEKGKLLGYRGADTDITERKRAEKIQLVLYNIANAVNKTEDLNELFKSIQNQLGTIIDTTNFYIALYNKENDTLLLPYFVDEKHKFRIVPAGKTLTVYIIKNDKPLLATEESIKKLTRAGEVKMFGKIPKVWLGVPLKTGKKVIGALVIQSYTDASLYAEKDLEILKFVSEQIAIAIEHKRAQEELKQSFEKLRRTLEETVNALASTTEKRDPYTAGHQRRVTQLACAIAKEIGLAKDQIEGIRVAAILHDIGKIYVASEILNKPDRLTESEFGIMKTHPRMGYDILKPIEFPWPVADIVLQHHERLDGSGYPQAFKDGDILLEARILAVADVVEAMSSHRPYRPACGLEVVLEELSKNNGILYDPQVVGVCLKLFKEKGFRFK